MKYRKVRELVNGFKPTRWNLYKRYGRCSCHATSSKCVVYEYGKAVCGMLLFDNSVVIYMPEYDCRYSFILKDILDYFWDGVGFAAGPEDGDEDILERVSEDLGLEIL